MKTLEEAKEVISKVRDSLSSTSFEFSVISEDVIYNIHQEALEICSKKIKDATPEDAIRVDFLSPQVARIINVVSE